MLIGRITVRTSSETDDIVDKIIAYEQNPPSDAWNKNVLMVADDDSPSFKSISEQTYRVLTSLLLG